VGGLDLIEVGFDAQPGLGRQPDLAALDGQRLPGQAVDALLPDPVRVQRGVVAGGGRADVGEQPGLVLTVGV
jgi:hypothetical protein